MSQVGNVLDTRPIETDGESSRRISKKTKPSRPDLERAWVSLEDEWGLSESPGKKKKGRPEARQKRFAIELQNGWEWESSSGAEGYPSSQALSIDSELLKEIWESMEKSLLEILVLITRPVTARVDGKGADRGLDERIPKKGERAFIARIMGALEAEPFEDGFHHPAEVPLREWLEKDPSQVEAWLFTLLRGGAEGGVVAPILRCFGRVAEGRTRTRGLEVLRPALEHEDLEVRDAAVVVLENWGGKEAIRLLEDRRAVEPVDWLRDYIVEVLEDLKEG